MQGEIVHKDMEVKYDRQLTKGLSLKSSCTALAVPKLQSSTCRVRIFECSALHQTLNSMSTLGIVISFGLSSEYLGSKVTKSNTTINMLLATNKVMIRLGKANKKPNN